MRYIASIVGAGLFGLFPFFVKADTVVNSGPVTWYSTHGNGNTVDSKTCVFFQVNNDSTIYVIPYADASFQDEFTTMLTSYLTGETLTFAYPATTAACGVGGTYNWAHGLALGTMQ